ncbi:hypothetical protein DPX16_19948 [Anabarilius grahami]|uniref:Uncharacterized protein n=1 Tax=Anabarilius grahami TaxID=495550 RepID=A0A3N0YGS9_ANAGA|nr:hypothetical protein DPX16_19948 [Anabarilius grahami]
MDVLLGRQLSSIGLVCQGNFGPRRRRREPTPQSAFVATSSLPLACPNTQESPHTKSGYKWNPTAKAMMNTNQKSCGPHRVTPGPDGDPGLWQGGQVELTVRAVPLPGSAQRINQPSCQRLT